ncbi:MAG: Mov34/MPN/PAD-1 family protein [Candidatus Heimdallarchaeota archaeon]
MKPIHTLQLTKTITSELETALINGVPNKEICGLLGGLMRSPQIARATTSYPIPNLSAVDNRFSIHPKIFYQKKIALEKAGFVPLALYHSHPGGVTEASFRDLELPRLTGLLSLILAFDAGTINVACYGYFKAELTPITVVVETDVLANG